MAVSNFTLTDSLKAWDIDQHAGKMINIEGEGNHNFQYITSNTTNTLRLESLIQVISIGKTYTIYDCTTLSISDLNKTIVVKASNLNYHGIALPSSGIANKSYLNIYSAGIRGPLFFRNSTYAGYYKDNGASASGNYIYLEPYDYISLIYDEEYGGGGWYITDFKSGKPGLKNVVNYITGAGGQVNINLLGTNEICKVVVNGIDTNIIISDGTNNTEFYLLSFELHVEFQTLNTLSISGISITWLDGIPPTFDNQKTYVIIFRRTSGNNFIANLAYTY